MMRYPVTAMTPMTETDLRLHLGKQTDWKVGLVDIAAPQSALLTGFRMTPLEAILAAHLAQAIPDWLLKAA